VQSAHLDADSERAKRSDTADGAGFYGHEPPIGARLRGLN
jgi:hypothetical protein